MPAKAFVPIPSNATPLAPGAASAGTSPDVARADHVHPAQSVSVPSPSNAAPQAIGTATAGVSPDYARADHVHALPPGFQSIKATTDAAGAYTWTYSTPYGAGVTPVIEALAVGAGGSTDVINVQLNGTPTNTSCQIRVTRTAQSAAALLGLTILSIPASVGATVVHLTARAP